MLAPSFDVTRQALDHLAKSQVLGEGGEASHAPGHGLEHGQSDVRAAAAEIEDGLARQKQEPRRRHGDGRGDIPLPVKERRLAEGSAHSLRVEYLLAAARGDLAHLDGALGDDEEARTRVSRFERVLASLEGAGAAAARERLELAGGQLPKVR